MKPLLDAIADGWSWKLGKPVALIATNSFGNAIVRNDEGHYFRLMPEEWQCELLARSPAELEAERKKEQFIRDWEMVPLIARAKAALGSLADGQVYCLVIPSVLGGKYSEENIRIISLQELLAYSGSMARQLEKIPDDERAVIVPNKGQPNSEGRVTR
jgi:hypothetical protein